jgi:ATP-dependent protease ClpP protease subunit
MIRKAATMIRLPSNLARHRAAWRAAEDVTPRDTPCFRMEADAATPKLYVYDVIGGWDSDAGEFVKAVHAIDSPAIDLHINSPGGFVYDAVAMFESLAGHDADVAVHVDGLAASAASFLAMVGKTIEIAKAGRMMIHDAQVLAWGSPADLREAADLGEAVSDDIAGFYADRAGGKPADWRARMTATTWYSSSEAVAAGLADRVKAAPKKTTDPEDRASQMIRARARVTLGGVR